MPSQVDYFSDDALRSGLKAKTVRGGLYATLAQGLIAAIALVMVPLMARLLQPADFGLVAMVTVFTGFAAMFVDAGFSMSTIQHPKINHQQVSNLFWITAVLGFTIACVTCLLSPAIAWFYGEPRLIPITCTLACSFILSGLTVQHLALLRRAMRFNAVTLIQVASYASSYAVAISIAWCYRTYWALVALPLSIACFRLIGAWTLSGWTPSFPRRESGMRELVGFGTNITGFTFINYFARNGDNMLIGWQWGDVSLGFYDRAYKLMMTPLTQINTPLMNVIIPALSRLRDEPTKYREAYFRATSLLQIVSCPLMAFVAVTAPWIVDVLFGPRWAEVVPILRWLAVAGFVQPISNSLGWLYVSQGRTKDMLVFGLVGSPLIVISFVMGLAWGPVGVARSYALVFYCLIIPLGYWLAGRSGPIHMIDLLRMTAYSVIYALPTVVVSSLTVMKLSHLTSGVGLLISGATSAIASGFVVFCTHAGRSFVREVVELLWHTLSTSQRQHSAKTPPPGP